MILNVRTAPPKLINANDPMLAIEQFTQEQQTENQYLFEQIAKAITALEEKVNASPPEEENNGETT